MGILEELLNNPEQFDTFLRHVFNNPSKRERYRKLLALSATEGFPFFKQYVQSLIVEPGLKKIQEASQNPFYCEIPDEYLLGIIAGNLALDPKILIRLYIERLSGSILISGATGSGKTNVLLWLLKQIADNYKNTNVRFLVISSKQNCEERALLDKVTMDSVYFLDKKLFAFNPLQPSAEFDYKLQIADVARCISTELGLYEAGQLYFQNKLMEFCNGRKATLNEFVEWLNKHPEKSRDYAGYRDRVLVRLNSVMDEIGNIFDYETGLDTEFITENIIIEIPCSSTFIISLIASLILMRVYRIKSSQPDFKYYRNILVFEDIYDALARKDSRD